MVKVNMLLLQFAHTHFDSSRGVAFPCVTFLAYNISVLSGRSTVFMLSNMEATCHIHLLNTWLMLGRLRNEILYLFCCISF